ncbi:HNH endonuclease signature motif containing protein, partial [Nocardioides flavus (ex Wang et al. 2016)]
DDVHFAGTMRIEAEVDLADALDLHRAVAHGAETLKTFGSTESLDARRAKALGDLARTQTALDLHATGVAETSEHPDGLPAARQVVIHAHFDATLSGDTTVFGPTGRMENGQRLVLLQQIRAWCGDTRTQVTVKPVIDLNTPLTAQGYDIPDRIREQVILRDRTCVFPDCSRPARGCDIDHVVPWDEHTEAEGRPQPGPTTTSNLAALCRFHHRLKTHSGWRFEATAPGVFEWTAPHGYRYRRDRHGTTELDAHHLDDLGLVTGARAPSSTTGPAPSSTSGHPSGIPPGIPRPPRR